MLSDFIAWILGTDGQWRDYVTRHPTTLDDGSTVPELTFVMRRKVNGVAEYRRPTADEQFAAWDSWQW